MASTTPGIKRVMVELAIGLAFLVAATGLALFGLMSVFAPRKYVQLVNCVGQDVSCLPGGGAQFSASDADGIDRYLGNHGNPPRLPGAEDIRIYWDGYLDYVCVSTGKGKVIGAFISVRAREKDSTEHGRKR